ncbi:MAG: hypothetical protein QXY61_03335 [Candidatus Anstonellales archaeon]
MDEFEEIESKEVDLETASEPAPEEKKVANRPDFRILQPSTDKDGKPILKSVGAMWKATSKSGQEFYVMKIGELRLLVFKNEPRE